MEQGNWNVDEMLHWLDMKINREDRDIREQSKKMNGNFLHFFEWNAESLYKSHFMSGCYKILRQAVDGAKDMDTVRNIVEDNIAYCESKLLNGQVDCNSSSRTTNVAHFLKLECMQQLVRDYREFANILAQTPPEENLQQTANKIMKMKLIISGIMLTLLCLLGGCDDKLEVQQAYDFSLTSWYLQKTISPDETVEIRLTLNRSGNYEEAGYQIGYIQMEGSGEVYDKKKVYLVNREMQPLDSIAELDDSDPCRQVFTLFYHNRSSKNAEIKFVIADNFHQERELDISFQSKTETDMEL